MSMSDLREFAIGFIAGVFVIALLWASCFID